MKIVEPIRESEKIEEMKTELLRNSYRDYFLFVFGINSGLRISDILPLQVKEVKGKEKIYIKEKKTEHKKKRARFIPIIPVLKVEIEKYIKGMDDEDYLFKSTKSQNPISRIQAYRILNTAASKVGLEDIGTHTMRKTFGYHYYQYTKDIMLLQEIFQHSSPSITKRYIGINEDMIKESLNNWGGL